MSAPFAHPADYARRGYDSSVWAEGVLAERLAMASREVREADRTIDARVQRFEDPDQDGGLDPEIVADVVCAMVARSAPVDDVPMGAETSQLSVDIFQRSFRFSAGGGAGAISMWPSERKKLGIRSRAASIDGLGDVVGGWYAPA